jgi:hypothetical protein
MAVLWVTLPSDTQVAVLSLLGVDPQNVPGLIGLAVIFGRLVAQPKVRGSD